MNMLDKYVGRNQTKMALNSYLQSHAYGSATAADLWKAFDDAQVSVV